MLYGVKGLRFTPGEGPFRDYIMPGKSVLGEWSGSKIGLGTDSTSYWFNATKSSGTDIYDIAAGAIRYADVDNVGGAVTVTPEMAKEYGLTPEEMQKSLSSKAGRKGSIGFAAIDETINNELSAKAFFEPSSAIGGGDGSLNAIQSKSRVNLVAHQALPELESGMSAGNVSPDYLKRRSNLGWMQDFVRNIQKTGVADSDLPSGALDVLNAKSNAEYESAFSKYLSTHSNETVRSTMGGRAVTFADIVGDSAVFSVEGHGRQQTLLSNLDPLIEESRASAAKSRLTRGSKLQGRVSGGIATRVGRDEFLQRAVRSSSQTADLMSAAGAASRAVAGNNSQAMRLAGAATTILRRRAF